MKKILLCIVALSALLFADVESKQCEIKATTVDCAVKNLDSVKVTSLNVIAPNSEWSDEKLFKKVNEEYNGSYWVDDEKLFIIVPNGLVAQNNIP